MPPLGKLTAHGEAEEGEEIEVAVRPENLKLQSSREAWLHLGRARITDVVFQGSFKRMIAVSDGMPRPADDPSHRPPKRESKSGEHVDIYCRPADLILLQGMRISWIS